MATKNLKEEINISDNYSRRLISGRVTATAGIHNFDTLRQVYGPGADRFDVLRAIQKQRSFDLWWFIIFGVLGIACLIAFPSSWFNILDMYVCMININLVTRGKVIGIYVGILECFMYAYICFTTGLYGEVIKMFAINVPLNIIAIINWTKNLKAQKKNKYSNEKKESGVVIRKLKKKSFLLILPLMGVLYVGCYFGLELLGTTALFLSAATLTFSIVAKVLSGMRYKENYIFSVTNNIISIGMWIQIIIVARNYSDIAMLISAVMCCSNGIYGYITWQRMYRQTAINGTGTVLALRNVNIKKIIKLKRTYKVLYWNREVDINKNS